ncbi:NADH-quinone oxidoreductase subunit K [Thermoflexales bacterium]|nr:NADH-quinone oxidoreductase subunit K [Thermoflexales bacterium]
MTTLQIAVIGVLGLIGIGLYGLLIARNLIKVIVALQVLVKGALLALVAAGLASGKLNLGQSLAVMVIVVDTVVAVIGLALALQVKRRMGTLDIKDLSTLKK